MQDSDYVDTNESTVDGEMTSLTFLNRFPFLHSVVPCLLVTDTITAVEYNGDGEYLATGDRVGRITVLKLENESKVQVRKVMFMF